jgi:predicted RNase H-like nuclease (RuvC/YqgF family)
LSRENLNLRSRVEALDKENKDIKDQLQSESTQKNSKLQSESKQINSQLQSDNKQLNSQLQSESKQTEENEREKEEYYESHPDLETMADVVKTNSDFNEATTNKMNENSKDGIYKEKRLLIDSGNNIIYLFLICNLFVDY